MEKSPYYIQAKYYDSANYINIPIALLYDDSRSSTDIKYNKLFELNTDYYIPIFAAHIGSSPIFTTYPNSTIDISGWGYGIRNIRFKNTFEVDDFWLANNAKSNPTAELKAKWNFESGTSKSITTPRLFTFVYNSKYPSLVIALIDYTKFKYEIIKSPTNTEYGIAKLRLINDDSSIVNVYRWGDSRDVPFVSENPYDPSVNPDAPPTPVKPDAPEPKPPKPPEGDTLPRATFYKNISDKEHVTKDITEIVSYDITFKEPTDILNPTIKISGSDIDTIIQQSNYMYIDKLKRYYYITGMRIVRSGLIEVTGHVDVLMSFNAEIRNQKAIIKRQANSYNLLLDDNNFQFQANPIIKTQTFPQNFHDLQYILSVIK